MDRILILLVGTVLVGDERVEKMLVEHAATDIEATANHMRCVKACLGRAFFLRNLSSSATVSQAPPHRLVNPESSRATRLRAAVCVSLFLRAERTRARCEQR